MRMRTLAVPLNRGWTVAAPAPLRRQITTQSPLAAGIGGLVVSPEAADLADIFFPASSGSRERISAGLQP
jgi:hypothetical protein